VAVYSGPARRIILSLKHGDRLDVAAPLGRWMAGAAEDLIADIDVVAPVPLHWSRLLRRKYNQAALLAQAISTQTKVPCIPDLLLRNRRTTMQKGMRKQERLANQRQAVIAHPKQALHLRNKRVLLVDDVLTTGATLSACAEACYSGGADDVNAVVFARVATDR
jgi:ComF family protein